MKGGSSLPREAGCLADGLPPWRRVHSYNVRISLLKITQFVILALHPSHSLPTALGRVSHNYHPDPEGPFACRLPPAIPPSPVKHDSSG